MVPQAMMTNGVPKNEDRWKEKQRGKRRNQKRKNKHREKFQNFKDFNEKY